MVDQLRVNTLTAIAAISGAILLFLGTMLHPMSADPNQPLAAFTEYAADRHWVATHLMQLLGVGLMVVALVLLSRRLHGGGAKVLAVLGEIGAIVSFAVAATLQAVDGIALKSMVNTWSRAADSEKAMLFYATVAVRQIEIGLASMMGLLLGITVVIYGIALWIVPDFPNWLGLLAIFGGVATVVASIVMAYTGFSDQAMLINMPSSLLLLVWMVLVGIHVWRKPHSLDFNR
jgi:hypothetical protein